MTYGRTTRGCCSVLTRSVRFSRLSPVLSIIITFEMLFVVKRILILGISEKENVVGMTYYQREDHRFPYNHLKKQYWVLSDLPPFQEISNKIRIKIRNMLYYLSAITSRQLPRTTLLTTFTGTGDCWEESARSFCK